MSWVSGATNHQLDHLQTTSHRNQLCECLLLLAVLASDNAEVNKTNKAGETKLVFLQQAVIKGQLLTSSWNMSLTMEFPEKQDLSDYALLRI